MSSLAAGSAQAAKVKGPAPPSRVEGPLCQRDRRDPSTLAMEMTVAPGLDRSAEWLVECPHRGFYIPGVKYGGL